MHGLSIRIHPHESQIFVMLVQGSLALEFEDFIEIFPDNTPEHMWAKWERADRNLAVFFNLLDARNTDRIYGWLVSKATRALAALGCDQ